MKAGYIIAITGAMEADKVQFPHLGKAVSNTDKKWSVYYLNSDRSYVVIKHWLTKAQAQSLRNFCNTHGFTVEQALERTQNLKPNQLTSRGLSNYV